VFSISFSPPPTSTLFPYTTLFRSAPLEAHARDVEMRRGRRCDVNDVGPGLAQEFGEIAEIMLDRKSLVQLTRHQRLAIADRHDRSEEHTSELQSPYDLVCRLLLEK